MIKTKTTIREVQHARNNVTLLTAKLEEAKYIQNLVISKYVDDNKKFNEGDIVVLKSSPDIMYNIISCSLYDDNIVYACRKLRIDPRLYSFNENIPENMLRLATEGEKNIAKSISEGIHQSIIKDIEEMKNTLING